MSWELVSSLRVFANALGWVLAYGLVHEASHWVAIWMTGGRIRRVTLGSHRGQGFTVGRLRIGWIPLGVATEFQARPGSARWCALSGPLLPMLAWPWTPWPGHLVMALGVLTAFPGFSDGALAFPDAQKRWATGIQSLSVRAGGMWHVLYNGPHHSVPRQK